MHRFVVVDTILMGFHGHVHKYSMIEKSLTSEQYDQLLRSADVVVIPYRPEAYGGRTSGIFGEALAAGKVVIASRWPWIERRMGEFPCGVRMETYSAAAFERAILRVVEEYPRLVPREEVLRHGLGNTARRT